MNLKTYLRGLSVLLVSLFIPLLSAQDVRGRIQGIVTDQSGAVVADAKVTLLNVNTGVAVVRQSSNTGLYIFDLVDPGSYTITIETPGFSKFVQENIVMQSRGDITVNASMKAGAVQDSVTVSEAPDALEFNSANKEMTIDSKMATEIPRIDRNPFKMTLIAPSAVNTRGEMQPYHSWSANSVDLGGGTNLKNDLLVDGLPIGFGQKNSTPPNTDAVQEVIVSTNSVDAESGHSAGGGISVTTKSGTNEFHGSAFYLGRYPWLSAVADRTTLSPVAQRQNMFGGTFGNPIIKNKLFNFFSLEYWKVGYPNDYKRTVPTAAEQVGDFSHSLTPDGKNVRTIFDPYTTVLHPDQSVTVTPFAGNQIPTSRVDPLSANLMKQFWAPNNPGIDASGTNNFQKAFIENYDYYNFSDRVDYNVSDKWKIFGRFARYNTTDLAGNPTPNKSQLYVPTGTSRGGNSAGGDVIWTATPRTVVELRGGWNNLVDSYISPSLGANGWASIWPNNPWYEAYQKASVGVPVYFPNFNIGGNNFGGGGFYWNQHPASQSMSAKIAHQHGSHYIKAGLEQRESYGLTYVSSTSNFVFNQALTANTFNHPDLTRYGNAFATFLLGALDDKSQMVGGPAPDPHVRYYGMYIQDDWKVSRNITVSLGLRNEYETPVYDPSHLFSKGLDIYAPVPEMAANPPQMPKAATDIVGDNFYHWTGQWRFTSAKSPGMWKSQIYALQPRAGLAYRINDKTALRIGYARYDTPYEMNIDQAPVPGYETVGFLEPPFLGATGSQNTLQPLAGIPQQTISNPFPASNPLLPIVGKGYGGNLGRGGQALLWYNQNQHKAHNDRLNINIQRQLPGQIVVSGTYFVNFGQQQYAKNLNNLDPRLEAKYQNQLDQPVDNPFYNYLTPTLFPGPLRNQPQVKLRSLLVPYPQYGGLYELGVLGAAERYQSVELKAQKVFSKGYNFLVSYVYIREKAQTNGVYGGNSYTVFNDLQAYTNELVWQDSDQPHHRFNVAGTWELPIGRGKPFLGSISRVADTVVGGWKLAGLFTFISGDFPRFANMNVTGDPCVSNPTSKHWFNTQAFSAITGEYVLRTNPLQYGCLTGPKFWTVDANLTKSFNITERIHAEMKLAAYNATNHLNLGDPSTDINNQSTFGQALYQGSPGGTFGAQGATAGNGSGRQIELGMKILF